jgi:MFS family permease
VHSVVRRTSADYPRAVRREKKVRRRAHRSPARPAALTLSPDSPHPTESRGIINTYLNDYLSSDKGLSVEGATLVVLVFGAGNFLGTLIGGIGSSRIYERWGRRYPAVLSSGAAIAGCLPFWGMINYDLDPTMGEVGVGVGGVVALGSISLLAGVLSGITGPIVKSTLQNVTMPRTRGAAFALHTAFDDLGRGLGPAFVARMIERFGGRRRAFNVGAWAWVACGVLNGALFCTVEADEERVRLGVARMAAAAANSDAGERNPSDRGDREGADLL